MEEFLFLLLLLFRNLNLDQRPADFDLPPALVLEDIDVFLLLIGLASVKRSLQLLLPVGCSPRQTTHCGIHVGCSPNGGGEQSPPHLRHFGIPGPGSGHTSLRCPSFLQLKQASGLSLKECTSKVKHLKRTLTESLCPAKVMTRCFDESSLLAFTKGMSWFFFHELCLKMVVCFVRVDLVNYSTDGVVRRWYVGGHWQVHIVPRTSEHFQ
ncbi:hypothetical protein MRX96_018107 [Rhipicephalus microplus]